MNKAVIALVLTLLAPAAARGGPCLRLSEENPSYRLRGPSRPLRAEESAGNPEPGDTPVKRGVLRDLKQMSG